MLSKLFGALRTMFGMAPAVSTPPAAAAPDRMPCPKCGETIKIDAKICRFCGFRIVSGTTELMVDGKRISGERRG